MTPAETKLAAQKKGIVSKQSGAQVTGFNAVKVAGAADKVATSKKADSGFSFSPNINNVPFVIVVGLIVWFFLLKES